MQKFINVLAVVLIIAGIVLLSYTGITYQTQEKVAQIGDVKITAETDKTIPFSPIAGGLCLALGIGLIVFNRMKR
ncbi:MAG TPA: DUF3185 domain-containing protein [Gammaproteobacteria bacterium]|nr:DUF3185 domain-containing protein [Gammaproteobacteria bacterium]